jgi:3' terminal RNA ribose 2'-O-methyltransferase Hen1
MLLTIRTTHRPATDLGYLVYKHPDRAHTRPFAFGTAHVLWPEATEDAATLALLLEIDPVSLVRGRPTSPDAGPLAQYVNDRPYVASSLLSVAMARMLRDALNGRCRERPELVDTPIPLEITLPVLPSRGGAAMLRRLFEPLGYTVEATRLPRDEQHPEWGDSALHHLVLTHTLPLRDALRHLYVLIPVLDDDKHYWVGDDEIDKLLARGEGWLADHPDRDQIALRYLKRRRSLARRALSRLLPEVPDEEAPTGEPALEAPLSLQKRRIARIAELLAELGAESVADLGCGEGQLLAALVKRPQFTRILGVDVSPTVLDRAARRLRLDDAPQRVRDRLQLVQGALGWRDRRLDELDAAAVIEVIEHMEPDRLPAFAESLFGHNRPRHVLVSTPNAEYNACFADLPAGRFRHHDHRFEWTRPEFEDWARGVADAYGYTVRFEGIGDAHDTLGSPTQLGVFSR